MKERQCRLGESECGWMEWWMVVCGGGWDECDDFDRAVTVLVCSGRVPCGETWRETVCGGWMIVDGWGHTGAALANSERASAMAISSFYYCKRHLNRKTIGIELQVHRARGLVQCTRDRPGLDPLQSGPLRPLLLWDESCPGWPSRTTICPRTPCLACLATTGKNATRACLPPGGEGIPRPGPTRALASLPLRPSLQLLLGQSASQPAESRSFAQS